MKKIICILLTMIVCCSFLSACNQSGTLETTEEAPTMDSNRPLSDGKTLKVLAVGNSFSDDTTEYLYEIAKAEGVTDITLGRLYISGCALDTHWENAQNDSIDYRYDKNTEGHWNRMLGVSIKMALQEEDWDIITMQQASGTSGAAYSYSNLPNLIAYINENKTNPNARLVWHMTWAYQEGSHHSAFPVYMNDQMTMYTAICDTVNEIVLPLQQIHSVIPVGTAIQNARTSSIGDNLNRDTYHLNEMGSIIGAYTWYAFFVGKPLEKISIDTVAGITLLDSEKAIIMESVNNALATPYAVTESVNK